ncbi:MAG: histidinol-phosphate transaminase [Candidatus Omnitrophota bacterium]
MSKFWNSKTRLIKPYVPGEQPKDRKYIKLNTNESPYSPSPKVIEAIKSAANEDLRLYPDPVCENLRRCIAAYFGLSQEEVFVGNGSDEILAFSFAAFFEPSETILFPDVTYSFYPVYAELFGLTFKEVVLDDAFSVPVEKFLVKNGGIVIANPNAPTGKFLPIEEIKKIIVHNNKLGKVVIVDEAYIDFGGESAAGLVKEYPNLLVVQTLSKSRALAGLRVGFALGASDLIAGLYRIQSSINSYTLDRLALAGAIAAFSDESHFQQIRRKVIQTRERVVRELEADGFFIIPSQANFIFISYPRIQAQEMFRILREKGVLVRYFNKPRIENFLRVSIGSDEEMDAFLSAVKRMIC